LCRNPAGRRTLRQIRSRRRIPWALSDSARRSTTESSPRRGRILYRWRHRPSLADHSHLRPGCSGGRSGFRNLGLLLHRQRTSRILLQKSLPLLEGRRSRRRRRFSDHRSVHHRRGRPGGASCHSMAKHTGHLRRDTGRGGNRSHGTNLVGLNPDCDLLHRAGAGQRVLRNCHYRTWDRPVCVVGSRYVTRPNVVVIDVSNVRIIDDRGVACIDARYIVLTGAICRDINIARTKWKPTHIGSSTESNRCANSAASEANPCYKRRRIDGSDSGWTGNPAPSASEMRPAAVMGRRKSPWRIIHPAPSPRIDPRPVSIVIRGPSDGRISRHPILAVLRRIVPGSVLVEVFITNDVGRDVTCGLAAIFALVPG
jgi:hypothetical protein